MVRMTRIVECQDEGFVEQRGLEEALNGRAALATTLTDAERDLSQHKF